MKLSKICEKIKYECLQGSMDAEVRDIIYDSRKIAKETSLFCGRRSILLPYIRR